MDQPFDPDAAAPYPYSDDDGPAYPPSNAPQPQPPPYGYGSQPPQAYGYGYGPQPAPYACAPPPAPYAYAPQPLSSSFDSAERNRNRKIAIGVGVGFAVLVAVVSVVAIVIAAEPATPKRIALPSSFDGYSLLDNDASRTVENSIRSFGNSNPAVGQVYQAASIGVYADNTGDVPSLVALALPTSAMPAKIGASSHQIVDNLLSETATPGSAIALPTGAHGGTAECAYATFGAVRETVCAWSDSTTTGVLVSVQQPVMAPQQLGSIDDSLRDSVD